MRESQIAPGEKTLLVIEAVRVRSKSMPTAEAIVKHVGGLIQFYLDMRKGGDVALTGESPMVLLRDYLEANAGAPPLRRRDMT